MPIQPDQQFEQPLNQRKEQIDRFTRWQSGGVPIRRVELLSQRYAETTIDLVRAAMRENTPLIENARLDLDVIASLLLIAIAEDEATEKWYEIFEAP